jgi:D-alanyl-D-alanine-carboxypeptidase/D-alanyl-D-alanine-endopeptidase
MTVKKAYYLVLLLIPILMLGQEIEHLNHKKLTESELDMKIKSLMTLGNVHGLAISIFNHNVPVYKKTFGYKNAKSREPIATDCNIYGASLSKAVFAVFVMQLVEKGKLDLDKPLQSYLPKPIYD